MTRVNLLDPKLLTDQHLMAEYRELLMVPSALRRSLKTKTVQQVVDSIPTVFTLNAGHVKFFYDKLEYLRLRYDELRAELKLRNFNLDDSRVFDISDFPQVFHGGYVPTDIAILIITERIVDRIQQKPHWYRRNGIPLLGKR